LIANPMGKSLCTVGERNTLRDESEQLYKGKNQINRRPEIGLLPYLGVL
jgi:hypothetical protein